MKNRRPPGVQYPETMKTQLWLGSFGPACAVLLATAALAEEVKPAPVKQSTVPPPVSYQVPSVLMAPPPVVEQPVYVYDQKPLPQQPMLISPQDAQAIVERFRTNYPKLDSCRILIYVNRELVDEQSGLKVASRSEYVETSRVNVPASGTNSTIKSDSERSVVSNQYLNVPKSTPALADRQTIRDVERLCGRPLRLAGVKLVDQRLATQMLGDRPLKDLANGTEGSQASKDREVISKIADVVLEVLISSHNMVVPEVSGDKTYSVPDIQVTAIRLKDAQIIGQASTWDVMHRNAGFNPRYATVQDVTEATCLALMDDICQTIH